MKLRMVLGAIALSTLAACGGSNDTNATATEAAATGDASAPPASEAAPAAAAAGTPAKGAAPTKAFMVGKWAEAGECDLAIGFKADGTMDGPFDGWDLKGNELTMPPNPQKTTLTVIDEKTMEAKSGDRPPVNLVRCP